MEDESLLSARVNRGDMLLGESRQSPRIRTEGLRVWLVEETEPFSNEATLAPIHSATLAAGRCPQGTAIRCR